MRTLLVVLALCAGCGGASTSCEAQACTVVDNPNRCACGSRFCTACLCDLPDCSVTHVGQGVVLDCSASPATVASEFCADGGVQ